MKSYINVTGGHSVNRASIFLFGRQYINLSLTCSTLLKKMSECWKQCIERLWNEWKKSPQLKDVAQITFSPSSAFICNWIEGQPQIITSTLLDDPVISQHPLMVLREVQKYKILPFTKICPPVHTLRFGAFSNGAAYGNALFFDLNTHTSLEELSGTKNTQLYFTEDIHPIFVEDHILVLSCKKPNNHQIRIYSSNPNISQKKVINIPYNHILAMQVLNDYLVLSYDSYPHKLTAVSIDALLKDQNPNFIHLAPLRNYGKLIPYMDKLLLYSDFGNIDNPPSIQILNILNNAFQITDLPIKGIADLKFNFIDAAYCHLDKFFIMGQPIDKPSGALTGTRTVVSIDLSAQIVDFQHTLNICSNIQDAIEIFSNRIGEVVILIPEANNHYTLKFNYDIPKAQKGVTHGNSKSY